MRASILAATLLLTLSLTDALLTQLNIYKWGIECEFNPIMRNLIVEYGAWIMYVVKGFFGGGLIYLLHKTAEEKLQLFVVPSLFVAVGAYGVVVLYGWILLMT